VARLAAAVLLLAAAAAAVFVLRGDEDVTTPGAAVTLARCEMNVDEFPVPAAGVQRLVPDRYRLSRYVGTRMTALDTWVLECARVRIDGRDRGRAVLSLVAAVVRDPTRGRGPRELIAPNEYHHYLLWAHTTSSPLAVRLRRAGMPAEVVDAIRRSRARAITTTVPAPEGRYSVRMDPRTVLDQVHSHDNSWWSDRRGGGRTRLRLRAARVNDHACAHDPCSRITAARGSRLAAVLGARSRTSRASFDHLPLDAEVDFETAQPNGERGRS
jgi:hypothetical protein